MKFVTMVNKLFIIPLSFGLSIILLGIHSCTDDYFVPFPIPVPEVPLETVNLEATYVSSPPTSVNSIYWQEADYSKVVMTDLSTHNLYSEDGLLNVTGTYNGVESFNGGADPELILKAAYDDINLYMLIEWTDSYLDASRSSWLWNGKPDPLKPDSANGWTSQRNDDKLALAFEIEPTSGPSGIFSNVGCVATCHQGTMKPETGNVDIWNWSLALSEPLGFAFDMHADQDSGLVFDEGQISFTRNITIAGDNRSGPVYEWSGATQEFTNLSGANVILDPAYYLVEKIPFTGNISYGEKLYFDENKGCFHCHGEDGNGNGDIDNGPAFTNVRMNRFSRENLINLASSPNHTGQTYFNKLSDSEQQDVIAKIRGFAGVPGFILNMPESANADLLSGSNQLLARLDSDNANYKVLLIRKLNTEKENDVVFDVSVSSSYTFGIALMDNDGKNHIGSSYESLIFLEK